MSGYKRDIVIRVVPMNGAESFHWFADRLTDIGGHVRCTPSYTRQMRMREDLNRIKRPVVFARRVAVSIEVFIATMADQWFLQEIEEALDDTQKYSVFLSLDGGVVEREIVWGDDQGMSPMPLRGKTIAGATFTLNVQTKEPILPRGPMMTDPGFGMEYVENPGLEEWVGGQPTGWGGDASNGGETLTITQETTIISEGASSAKLVRSAGAQYLEFKNRPSVGITTLLRGRWYLARMLARGGSTIANAANIDLIWQKTGVVGGVNASPDGKTWVAGQNLVAPTGVVSTGWTTLSAHFRMPSDFIPGEHVYFRTNCYYTGTIYIDDCSIYGPALRPGVSTW